MADVNGFRNEFPQSYLDTIESMIVFYMNICYPGLHQPLLQRCKAGHEERGTEELPRLGQAIPEERTDSLFRYRWQKRSVACLLIERFPDFGDSLPCVTHGAWMVR